MRTPKGPKAGGRGAAGAKSQVNKLRKKAMKTKMMKKTMLALDDTKVRHATDITAGGYFNWNIAIFTTGRNTVDVHLTKMFGWMYI